MNNKAFTFSFCLLMILILANIFTVFITCGVGVCSG